MTPAELAKYQAILLALRARMRQDYNHLAESGLQGGDGDLSSLPIHLADMGSDTYEQDFTITLMESSEDALEQIEDALERIEEGTYGTCVECDSSIPQPRLEAIPYTPYCLECAARMEDSSKRS